MDLSWSLLNELGGVSATFLPKTTAAPSKLPLLVTWKSSRLNPKNRIDSLDLSKESKWCIDGYGISGCQVFASPIFPVLPLRFDVFLPDQTEVSEQFRYEFQWSNATESIEDDMSELGISRYLIRAPQSWSDRRADLEDMCNGLWLQDNSREDHVGYSISSNRYHHRFRSWAVTPVCQNFAIFMEYPRVDLAINSPTPAAPSIRQLNESISLVHIPHLHGTKLFALKSPNFRTEISLPRTQSLVDHATSF